MEVLRNEWDWGIWCEIPKDSIKELCSGKRKIVKKINKYDFTQDSESYKKVCGCSVLITYSIFDITV